MNPPTRRSNRSKSSESTVVNGAPAALERLRDGHKLGKAYVDKTKLTDHHAILPTGKTSSPSLSPPLR